MSAELLDAPDDRNGTTAMLSMNVYGYAFLTLMEPTSIKSPGGEIVYTFSPDETGLKSAQLMIESLQQWINHIEVSEQK